MNAGRRKKIERALVDPSDVYSEPEDVLRDDVLTREEKTRILRRWAFDVAELAVATEEGMPHGGKNREENLAQRILLALGKLQPEGGPDTGPSKHHVPSDTP